MKRIFGLIVILLLMSGCEAVYTIEINGTDFKETFEINNRNPETWLLPEDAYKDVIMSTAGSYIPTDFRLEETDMPVEGVNYYQIELIDAAHNLGLRFFNNFKTVDEYRNSSIARNHFPLFQVLHSNEELIIKSGRQNHNFDNYNNLTKFTVRLITSNEVLEHNADSVENGVHSWTFTEENYENKTIDIKLSDSSNNPNVLKPDADGYFGIDLLILIYILIGIVAVIAGVVVLIKVSNSNR